MISYLRFYVSAFFFFGSFAWAQIGIDVTVSGDRSHASSKAVTPAFSTASPNELLLAFIATDGSTSSQASVVSVSGGGLVWQPVARSNAQAGDAEIWRAFSTAALSNVSVVANLSQSVASSVTVMSFTGADTSGSFGSGAIGATAIASGASGVPFASLTTTRANSFVIGVGNDWDNAIPRTVGPGQTLVHQYLAGVGDTYWVQRETNLSSAGVPVPINDTAPTSDRFNLAICEILGASSSSSSSLTVNAGSNVTIPEGQSTNFSGSVSGGTPPYSYSWNFGDGGTAATASATHVYANPGSYTATLVVKDSSGASAQSSLTATVQDVAPVLSGLASYSGTAGVAISFSASASTPNAQDNAAGFSYSWNFGDGATSTLQNPIHTFSTAGTYNITVSATSLLDGAVGRASTTASIVAPVPPPASPPSNYSLFGSATPLTPDANDSSAVELGVQFHSDLNGTILGIRFYKGTNNTGTHTGHLWSSSGSLLASVTFTNESVSGWQQAVFSNPVSIAANTLYVASYFAPNGNYADDQGFFNSSYSSSPLHADAGNNGLYIYGSAGGFPNQTWNASNYYVDILFSPGSTVAAPLVANAAGPYSGYTGNPVSFSGSASGGTPPYTYAWNFGDGGTSAVQNPTYVFAAAGSYSVSLTVSDSAGKSGLSSTTATISKPVSIGSGGAQCSYSANLSGVGVGRTYTVDPSGSDSNSGSSTAPWLTLQHAADSVKAGDTVNVNPGTYQGFFLRTSGTTSARITFAAKPGALVNKANTVDGNVGIDAAGPSYITISGFTVIPASSEPAWSYGIRMGGIPPGAAPPLWAHGNVIVGNNVQGRSIDQLGIFTSWQEGTIVENNSSTGPVWDSNIYMSNSAMNYIVCGNIAAGSGGNGIHNNGDASQGGPGVINNALIERNIIHDVTCVSGGQAISCDGVQKSKIQNNLIYNTCDKGISLYVTNAAGPSTGNLVINNTVLLNINGSNNYVALRIPGGNDGNTVVNNIFWNGFGYGWVYSIESSVTIDYNAVNLGGGDPQLGLNWNYWQTNMGDKHSIVYSALTDLFNDPAGNDFHLKAGSPAIGRASPWNGLAPLYDLEGYPRPSSSGFDLGAYQFH